MKYLGTHCLDTLPQCHGNSIGFYGSEIGSIEIVNHMVWAQLMINRRLSGGYPI